MADDPTRSDRPDPSTLFARVGGEAFFEELVERFYANVAEDARLRPMYESDLGPARARLGAFLVQYFGGPRRYEALRGEPKLRMRHLRFPIDQAARDAWLEDMGAALEAMPLGEQDRAALAAYFADAATFFMNRGGLAIGGSS